MGSNFVFAIQSKGSSDPVKMPESNLNGILLWFQFKLSINTTEYLLRLTQRQEKFL